MTPAQKSELLEDLRSLNRRLARLDVASIDDQTWAALYKLKNSIRRRQEAAKQEAVARLTFY